ncbi:hypothetical protein H8356DRAFT_1323858 [Neocallimastix lanati (nom. inval.)]|nr:hypothetical protein H8356DRAFT_1323858 [Neocallimastix sp. JGI-2020a]
MNSTSSNLESEFENAVNAVRNVFNNKMSEKDSEVILLRNELNQKKNEIKDYIQKIEHLESQIYKSEKKMNEMSKLITKLSSFKKNILQSLGDEDIEEYKAKYSKNKTINNNENDYLKQTEIDNSYSNDYNEKYSSKKDSSKRSCDSPVPKEHQPETIDGRNFFKLARSKLSYDQFTLLLANVKAYNNRDQGKGKTLENIEIALGEEHHDLYKQFEKLLKVY